MYSVKSSAQFLSQPLMILLALVIGVCSFTYLDKPIAEYFYYTSLGEKLPFIQILTYLGTVQIYLILFLITALFFRYIKKHPLFEQGFWFLWLTIVLSNSIVCVLKIVLGRARPILWFKEHLYGFYGLQMDSQFWSLPSGHTTTIVSLALALAVIFPRYFVTLILMAAMLVSTRIILIQHFLSDVLTAFYLSFIIVGIFIVFLKKKNWLALIIKT